MVPCDWCSKPVTKKSYTLKTWKKSFCNNTCYFLRRAKDKHEAMETVRAAMDDCRLQLLQCRGKCRGDITEHRVVSKLATCTVCLAPRPEPLSTLARLA